MSPDVPENEKKNAEAKPSVVEKTAASKAARPRRAVVLTSKQRSYLRGLAHELKPVVQVGVAGLTAGVYAQVDHALETHELLKVKVGQDAPQSAAAMEEPLKSELGLAVAQRIGRTLVLYRPRKKAPTIRLPR